MNMYHSRLLLTFFILKMSSTPTKMNNKEIPEGPTKRQRLVAPTTPPSRLNFPCPGAPGGYEVQQHLFDEFEIGAELVGISIAGGRYGCATCKVVGDLS